jgi:hypothetical protein
MPSFTIFSSVPIDPFFIAAAISSGDIPFTSRTTGSAARVLYTGFKVSHPGATATRIVEPLSPINDPKMIIKNIGKASENTTDVGLRNVAIKLYFDNTKVARH